MKILNRISEGLTQVFYFCAIWTGALFTTWVLFLSNVWWGTKAIVGIIIIFFFIGGYRKQKQKDELGEQLRIIGEETYLSATKIGESLKNIGFKLTGEDKKE